MPHVAAYAVLATLLLLLGVRGLLGVALLIAVASIDELTQPWFARSCSLGDWVTDLAASLGVYGMYALMRNSRRRRSAERLP